jgi:hypothetical protein
MGPSTAKAHNSTNFDLGNITAVKMNGSIEGDDIKEDFKSTLPSLKHKDHASKMQGYTDNRITKQKLHLKK